MIAQVTSAFEVTILHSSCSGPFSELCDVCSGKATTATTGPHILQEVIVLHTKEGPTKNANRINLLHDLQITSRIYRVHLSLQKETKMN
jgi:hypothetical protein